MDLDALVARQRFTLLEDFGSEAGAHRARVDGPRGRGVLYAWASPSRALRAHTAYVLVGGTPVEMVPKVLSAAPEEGWVLLEDISGRPARREDDARVLARGIGRALQQVHSVPAAGVMVGDLLEHPEGLAVRWRTFSGYVAAKLEQALHKLDVHSKHIADEVRETLRAHMGELREQLSAFHPRLPVSLVHGQPSWVHAWVDEAGREVVALTGFERAARLPAEVDIAMVLWTDGLAKDDALVQALYQGYGSARTMDMQRRERFYRRLVALDILVSGRDVGWRYEELLRMASPAIW